MHKIYLLVSYSDSALLIVPLGFSVWVYCRRYCLHAWVPVLAKFLLISVVTFNKADVWNFREQVFAATFDYPHD
jgi:hypothetical protein